MSATYDPQTGLSFGGSPSDQGVYAEFYTEAVYSEFKSAEQGIPIHEDKVFIRIRQPGDRLNIVERPAKDADKQRFPMQWARFEQNEKQATEGTPLEQWPAMTPAQIATLKAMGIFSVQQMAAVSDGNLDHLGMGSRSLRDRARAYLEAAEKGAVSSKVLAENENLRAEKAALEANLADLAARVRAMEAERKSGED